MSPVSLNQEELLAMTANHRKARGHCGLLATFAFALGVGLPAPGGMARAADPPARRPNIVFLLSDDQRYDTLGVWNHHPLLKTPNLDRLAHEGGWFRQAFVVTPLCAPSRTAFLTGLYGHTSGFRTNEGPWPERFPPSFLSVAHDAGYRTAYVGKKHIYNTDEPLPGIDHWVSFVNQGLFTNPILNIDGTRGRHEGANGDLLTEQGIEFIKQNKDHPFAVTIAWKEAHSQQRPPHRYDPLFENDSIPLPSSFDEDKSTKPRYFVAMKRLPDSGFDDDKPRANPGPPPGATREDLAVKKIKNYYRCIEALDDYVGRLLKTLEEVGQLDNTIIVYAGDNGYFLGEHGRFEKMTPHEESVRIPLLIRYPSAIKPGTVTDAIVRNIDVAPTLYDLTGLKGPGTLDGRSLRTVLESSDRTGASADWPQDVYLEWQGRDGAIKPGTPGYVLAPRDEAKAKARTEAQKKAAAAYAINPIPTWRALRTQTHKYAVYLDGDLSELYDLRSDPNEAHNLIGDPAQKELIATLHQRLLQLADATHDPLRPLLSAEPSTQARPAPAPAP